MQYIIQENLFREAHYNLLIETLKRFEFKYKIVRVFPFIDKIVDIDDIPDNNDFNVDDLPDINISLNEKTFCFGSVKMARVASREKWYPGSMFNSNHDFEVYSKYYTNNLLNYDSYIQKISDEINWNEKYKFIRPTKDTKIFTGNIFEEYTWNELKNSLNNKFDDLIQISSVKSIYKEIRFWVINGKIITGSQYKIGNNVIYDSYYEDDAMKFAQEMVDLYRIADSFVIDVCLTENGWKIVELNCINCAGFYCCDIQKLIMSLEDYYE